MGITFNVFVSVSVLLAYPTVGYDLQFEGIDTLCHNESEPYPPPVYHTLEDAERSGLNVVDALYGKGSRHYVTGFHQLAKLQSSRSSKFRHKRAVTAQSSLYWPEAIVPYSFDDDVPPDEQHESLVAMKRHERFTCIRFVPWVLNKTRIDYGLPDEGHMRLVKRAGCWAFVGNNHSPNGQRISCCTRKSCVHELSHILGVFHDQSSPKRHDWLRINWNNIALDNWEIFIEEEPSTTLSFRYDVSSIMHYSSTGFKAGPWPSMTVLFKDLAPLIDIGGNVFYLWQEIAETNQCKVRHCPDFAIDCINDGYVSYVEGACRCLCPPGLDHTTGCRTVIKKVPSPSFWPAGQFGIFSADGNCPAPLSNIVLQTEAELFGQSDSFHLGGNITDEGVDINMCIKDFSTEGAVAWQTGQYCLLGGQERKCPPDFDVIEIPIPGFNLTICCRDDGYTEDDLYVPTDTPFVLLPLTVNGPCQTVQGMFGSLESLELQIDPTDISLPSILPIKVSKKYHVTIGFCYYTKYTTDCGGTIELSSSLMSTVITSPGYPEPYNATMECNWLIKGPPDSTIVIDFDDFDVGEKTDGCADDYFIIRYALLGQHALRHCGKGMPRSFRTLENVVTFNLHTDLTDHHEGFRATAKVILPENHCYNITDKGASYRGHVNFTRDLQPCLPWDRVTECPHHMFNPKDFHEMLEMNYCRNPDDSFRPWCYTKTYEGQCERNYCDVCRLERVYDNFPDCEQLKKEGLCEMDSNRALSECAKTCAVPLPNMEAPSSCSSPPLIRDGLMQFYKRWYDVGDTVTDTCPYGPDTLTRRCHSDGSWSPANYVCGVCSNGWAAYDGACYRFYPNLLQHTEAVDFCALHNSFLAPPNSFEELEFIVSLRPKLRRIWTGTTRKKGYSEWTNSDDRILRLNHWAVGQAAVRDDIVCVVINPESRNNTLRQAKCNAVHPFVCKRAPTPRCVCINRRWDCHAIVRRNPLACRDYPDFAWQQCPFTCGICEPKSTPNCAIRSPDSSVVVNGNDTKNNISRGEVITYSCRPGTVLTRGNLQRICEDSGWLSGEKPVCIDENVVVTPNNQVALVSRDKLTNKQTTYIGNNTLHRIHRKGEITQWRFYAWDSGTTCLQVWRPRPDLGPLEFEFVGQNRVESLPERVNIVDIPPRERIQVHSGDVIGLWSGNPASTITAHGCGSLDIPEAMNSLVLAKSVKSAFYFHVGEMYTATDPSCRIFSLTALVGERERDLSYTSMMPLEPSPRKTEQPSFRVYTGSNDYFRIRDNGSIVEWQLYSQSQGVAGLQVWRPRPDIGEHQFEFIGQNEILTENDSKQVISVPASEQIKVQENDVIGFYIGDPPGMLARRSCDKLDNPLALPIVFMVYESDFVVGNVSEFQALSSCIIYPLIAVVEI